MSTSLDFSYFLFINNVRGYTYEKNMHFKMKKNDINEKQNTFGKGQMDVNELSN